VPDTILLEEMTWRDVDEAIEAGRTTVVVAVGAVEQHGPHLPLLVDAVRGDRLAVEVARRLGVALVAPTIRIGCSEHHMAFPGTLTLRRSTLEAICLDYTVSLARHGFRRVCFVPSHGGNFGPLAEMLDDLRVHRGYDPRPGARPQPRPRKGAEPPRPSALQRAHAHPDQFLHRCRSALGHAPSHGAHQHHQRPPRYTRRPFSSTKPEDGLRQADLGGVRK
jgi:hypothetical protein